MNLKTSRRTAALATGLAVVAGSTLLIAGPASAAEIQVTDDQVAANETVYTGWHEGYGLPGSTTPPGADAVVTDAGLEMTGPSQIINGYAAPVAVDGADVTFATIAATAGVVSTNDLAYFQIPVYAETGVTTSFTTLRPENPGAAGLTGNWVASSDDIAGIAANTPTSIADLSTALGSFDLLAFGVLVIAGGDDVVQTISFNGDDYNFAAPVVAPVFDPLVVVDPDTIYFSDVRPGGAGFKVTVTGFTPGDTLTISVIDPNGEVFGSADGGDTVIADADGGFAAADLTFVGEGIQVGTYTFRVTDSAGVFAEDAIAVIADPVAAGAPVVPTLADTGSDSGVLVGGAAALLLLGAAGMLFAAARRKGAQVTA
ncbi:hypothetical protein [Plantibacter sp. VKM Ac-2876]|uniref:hypothetical protein n=1 Tax=Plantibacter sp. VKM Ac-2876 TaxID=2783826 RepID=UPI00188BF75B|nr:hypothetical protein [Plantibacter sp. VKM Ac-2876]MBF4566491.1 hypothetical protein [Plantibacter sp. VKM Ac-2876]